jgi:hypothetical protein
MSDLIEKPKKRRSGTNPDYDKPLAFDEWEKRTLVQLQKNCREFGVKRQSLDHDRTIKMILLLEGRATSISLSATVNTPKGKLTAQEMRQRLLSTKPEEAKQIIKALTPRAVDDDEAIEVEAIDVEPAEPVPEPVAPVEKKEVAFAHFDDESRRISELSIKPRTG